MSKERKQIIGLIAALVLLVGVAAFIIFNPREAAVIDDLALNEKQEEHDEHDALDRTHIHPNAEIKEVVYDKNPGESVEISKLVLSPPINLVDSYNPKSKTIFKGAFGDESLYIVGAKGQFYRYNLETGATYTFENLVREAEMDPLTGDAVFTREIEGSPGKVGVYKALKNYPEPVLIHETTTDFQLEEAAFFKGNVVMNFFNVVSRESSAVVKPIAGSTLNDVGQGLAKLMNGKQFNFSTDGTRLLAYDLTKNAVVELSNGTSVVYQQFDEPMNVVVSAVSGKNVLVSFNRLSDYAGFTYYNGKKIFDKSYAEIDFYDDTFVFVRDDEQSYLLDLLVPDVSPLTQFASSLAVTPNNMYFVDEIGDMYQIQIKKNTQ